MSYRYITGIQSEVESSKLLASSIKIGQYIKVNVYDSDISRETPTVKTLMVTNVELEGIGKYATINVTVDDEYADCKVIEFSVNETYQRFKRDKYGDFIVIKKNEALTTTQRTMCRDA